MILTLFNLKYQYFLQR